MIVVNAVLLFRRGMNLMICNILWGHFGGVVDINGSSLVSLYKTSHQSPLWSCLVFFFFSTIPRWCRKEFNCCSGSHKRWCVCRATQGNLSKSLIVYSLHWNIKGTERGMARCRASVKGPLLMKVWVCVCVLDDMSVWGATWPLLWPVRGDYEGGSLGTRRCKDKTV